MLRSWLKETKGNLHRLLGVTEVKISEAYWRTISEHCASTEFVRLLIRLDLQEILAMQTKTFLSSNIIQTAVSSIILHLVQSADNERANWLERKSRLNVEELLKLQFSIF